MELQQPPAAPEERARISIADFEAMLRQSLPMMTAWGIEVVALEHGRASLRLAGRAEFLRPGGTVSGPVLMGLADVALYAALLGAIGPVPLAVTSNLTINFLRKPGPETWAAYGRRPGRTVRQRWGRDGRPCGFKLRDTRNQFAGGTLTGSSGRSNDAHGGSDLKSACDG